MEYNKKGGITCLAVGLAFGAICLSFETPKGILGFALIIPLFFVAVGIYLLSKVKKETDNKSLRNVIINTKLKELVELRDSDGDTVRYIITYWVNPQDQKLYLFKKNYISYEEERVIKENNIQELQVRYEAGNIKNYEIDTTSLNEVNYETNR